MADLGTDILMRDGDIDVSFSLTSGRACLIADVIHRFQTRKGSLFWAHGDGDDLTLKLNESYTPTRITQLRAEVIRELLLDDRIQSARANVTLQPDRTLRIEMLIADGEGPFPLIVSVSSLTVEQLFL